MDDFLLSAYDYPLPEERIAQFPALLPGQSRLLVLDRAQIKPEEALMTSFGQLAGHLPPGALLCANNTRVMPARIIWQRKSGGKSEFLALTPLPLLLANSQKEADTGWHKATLEGLLKPAARYPQGSVIEISPDFKLLVLEKGAYGMHLLEACWRGSLEEHFNRLGSLPLPPYIRRAPQALDASRYQTIYAKKTGAMAAPTAGLHFTDELRRELLARGFAWQELTLHTGYGTFSPVREADIRKHVMHREYVEIDRQTAAAINAARQDGRPVIAIGTTSLRALEGVYQKFGRLTEFSGWIDIFIYPGHKFHVVDGLITNFHLPKSSLLMLVSAFAGRERILAAYQKAIDNGFRFFSYGDAMLIK